MFGHTEKFWIEELWVGGDEKYAKFGILRPRRRTKIFCR